ncbi:unnamed protein product, partial [Discosporangium mesarthrocarpum]
EAGAIAREAVSKVLDGKRYSHAKVAEWTDAITRACIDGLTGICNNFKYGVTCLLIDRTSDKRGGIHSNTRACWDTRSDGACTFRWENDTMACVLSVFGIAL